MTSDRHPFTCNCPGCKAYYNGQPTHYWDTHYSGYGNDNPPGLGFDGGASPSQDPWRYNHWTFLVRNRLLRG